MCSCYNGAGVAPLVLQAKSYGPIASGALFGAGWWFWVDAVVCTTHKIPFDQVGPEGRDPNALAVACFPRLPSQVSADKMKASFICPGAASDVRMRSQRSRQWRQCLSDWLACSWCFCCCCHCCEQYIPGLVATLALIMINCIRR